MKEQEIINGNKLIAEFMQVEVVLNSDNITVYWYYNPEKGYLVHMLKYHSSWDWLMPVVKKIQQLEIKQFDKKKPIMNALMDVDIESLYNSALWFILWYNKSEIENL